MPPVVMVDEQGREAATIGDGDGIIFCNYLQLGRALVDRVRPYRRENGRVHIKNDGGPVGNDIASGQVAMGSNTV